MGKCVLCFNTLFWTDYICITCQKHHKTTEENILKKLKRLKFIES
ncbi:hypothetical protein LCGC14_1348240 [marine sediment metagenome]|uniref:Uncharacterized protein n=1 Tax=marine sediment metagenome TaxID=412755 RepID=A0A0F9MSG3_9ZZZZ